MNKRQLFFLSIIVLSSSVLGFFMLTRGHVWPDDFAGYLLQAKSLLAWQMGDFISHNAFTIQNSSYPPGPLAYPWGFPLLLAPVYALFGLNPLALKLLGVLFYAIFLVSFFYLARTRLPETESLLLTGVFSVLPGLLSATDLILSDIPFLAFSTLSLFFIEHLSRGKPRMGFLTGFCIFMAFFLRTNGILLFAPLVISLSGSNWPRWQAALKRMLAPVLVFGGLLILQIIWLPGGQESYFSHFNMFTPQGLLDNILFYAWLPSWSFDRIPAGAALYPLLMVFVLISLVSHWRRDAAMHSYALLTLILFSAWPERQGLRFIYPLLPFLLISALDGMLIFVASLRAGWQKTALQVARGFWALMLVTCLFISGQSAVGNMLNGRDINGPFDQYSKQLYAFLREKTPENAVIIFMRPRALRLFTARDAFMTERCEDLRKGDYVALHEKVGDNGQISPDQVTTCNADVKLALVFNNKRFTVYKIEK